jgi:hypothetical protein
MPGTASRLARSARHRWTVPIRPQPYRTADIACRVQARVDHTALSGLQAGGPTDRRFSAALSLDRPAWRPAHIRPVLSERACLTDRSWRRPGCGRSSSGRHPPHRLWSSRACKPSGRRSSTALANAAGPGRVLRSRPAGRYRRVAACPALACSWCRVRVRLPVSTCRPQLSLRTPPRAVRQTGARGRSRRRRSRTCPGFPSASQHR